MNEQCNCNNNNYLQDIDGYDYVTNALMNTANSYPGLEDMEVFKFSNAELEEGLTIMAQSGAAIMSERESITGHVTQECIYPFMVIYKASGLTEKRMIEVKEWMDTFARWLSRQPVTIKNRTEWLDEWPKLSEGRIIRAIDRQSPSYLAGQDEDKCDNWVMTMQIRYRNEFDR